MTLKKTRIKVLHEICYNNDFSQILSVSLTVVNKFIIEDIDISSVEYIQVVFDCVEAMPEIIGVIVSRDTTVITDYVETIYMWKQYKGLYKIRRHINNL